MSQPPASTSQPPGSARATPLLLLSGAVWSDLAISATTLSAVALALIFVGLLTFIDPSATRRHPGIAPFDITVREVPVPVTRSHHFIVTLKRGQYPEWTRLETFKVIFDEGYVATCSWSWGREATWSMQIPPGGTRRVISRDV